MPLDIRPLHGTAYLARMSDDPEWVYGKPFERALPITVLDGVAIIHGLVGDAASLHRYTPELHAWLAQMGVTVWGWDRGDGKKIRFRVK